MPRRVLVIPQFNEESTILAVLERALPLVDRVVVVDDGSTDGSVALVRGWLADHPGGVLLALPRNRGMSGALLVGFAYVTRLLQMGDLAGDDLIINIDADGQHDPAEIPPALGAMAAAGDDVLLGRRDLSGYPLFKRVGNWGLSLWASLLSGYRYLDVECGFRVMRLQVVADFLPYFTGRRYGCAQEIGIITARRGWRINNRFPSRVIYYRAGARLRDGFTNLFMGLLSFLRVSLGFRRPLARQVESALAGVNIYAAPGRG